jgi:hypothetical protein
MGAASIGFTNPNSGTPAAAAQRIASSTRVGCTGASTNASGRGMATSAWSIKADCSCASSGLVGTKCSTCAPYGAAARSAPSRAAA